jgi:hypothetical protein
MAAVKAKVGTMSCPCCGHLLMVKQNEAGTMTLACDGCDFSGYAKVGTVAQTIFRSKIAPGTGPKEDVQQPAAPAPVALPAPAPVPVPKAKPAGVFDFLTQGAR